MANQVPKPEYVFKLPNGKYIGIDPNSGGYPYETSWRSCNVFYTKEDAKRYHSHWPKEPWILHKVIGLDTEIVD